MTHKIKADSWVYVLVQNPGNAEHIVGQQEPEHQIAFIPTFMNKESAMQGIVNLPKDKGHKYEIQAIIYEDLEKYAAEGKFLIFILDDHGRIIDKRSPTKSAG
ncbi:MAG: hypothetical protein PVG41_02375 [Desulfobacteraceae bacterium]|jgi:hypothetical protein